MKQDEIIEMAREAGFDPHDMSSDFTCNLENINAFARLVAAKEKEACAKLFDDRNKGSGFYEPHEPAEIIRARGEQA